MQAIKLMIYFHNFKTPIKLYECLILLNTISPFKIWIFEYMYQIKYNTYLHSDILKYLLT